MQQQVWVGVLLGLIVGVIAGAFLMWAYRKRIKSLRNEKTRRELEGNKVSTVSQLLHFAIQSAPDAIAVVDHRQRVLMSNPRAHELGLVHERSVHDEVWPIVEKVLDDHTPRDVAFLPQQRRSNRPVISVAGQVQLLSLMDDRYAVIYATDETENVRMESARRDFVANVSHELKTPVGAISLLVETLMEISDDQESVEYFAKRLMKETSRMSQMIAELISLSKLQGAESLPDPERLSIDAVVEDAIDRCRLAAETAGINLIKDNPVRADVHGDRNLLVTAVSNLISNAITYSPEGSPVSISRQVKGDRVTIRVTDRGIGIDPEDQKRVFERFFRVDKARARNTGGTGLGLAIVKHVMMNHGGDISIWSRPGTGSTFTLELPVLDRVGHTARGEEPVIPDATKLQDSHEHEKTVKE